MNRRRMLQLSAAALVSRRIGVAQTLASDDEMFLDDMQRRACRYFFEQASAKTGLVLDRASAANLTGALDSRRMASISATGFGLTALCIADRRGYLSRTAIVDRVRQTLRFHADSLPHVHGFFSHFIDRETGEPFRGSEISSIDTALFLCGALLARAYFAADREIVELATRIYERVDWPWMLNGGKTFSMGMRDGVFLTARWNHYSELMMLYLLAIGSPTHPVEAGSWDAWSRPTVTFQGITYLGAADPLFVHQFSHAWFDFRNKRDAYADYFANSILATRAHKLFCLSLGSPYSDDYWGISASDSEHGYRAWGGPPSFGKPDGSVVPNATAGSLPFLPAECLRVQRSLLAKYGEKAWGRYGFCDAFHPQVGWFDADVLGIDLGISVLMAENLRTGFVWETFAKNREVGVAMGRVGFRAT